MYRARHPHSDFALFVRQSNRHPSDVYVSTYSNVFSSQFPWGSGRFSNLIKANNHNNYHKNFIVILHSSVNFSFFFYFGKIKGMLHVHLKMKYRTQVLPSRLEIFRENCYLFNFFNVKKLSGILIL